jgi:hypothetical protein
MHSSERRLVDRVGLVYGNRHFRFNHRDQQLDKHVDDDIRSIDSEFLLLSFI